MKTTTKFHRGDEVRVKGWACTSLVVGVEDDGKDLMVWILDTSTNHGCYKPCVWMHPHQLELVTARRPVALEEASVARIDAMDKASDDRPARAKLIRFEKRSLCDTPDHYSAVAALAIVEAIDSHKETMVEWVGLLRAQSRIVQDLLESMKVATKS